MDFLAETLGPLPLTPDTRQTLVDYVKGTDAPATAQNVDFVPPAPAPFRQGRRAGGRGYNRLRAAGLRRP